MNTGVSKKLTGVMLIATMISQMQGVDANIKAISLGVIALAYLACQVVLDWGHGPEKAKPPTDPAKLPEL